MIVTVEKFISKTTISFSRKERKYLQTFFLINFNFF